MAQTFYIESDEEIISVIGRLRKSSSEENIFVFPKRALVLQSIINLRLLQREAEKLGKRIIIVSQDDNGRMLAEKAGIETENYSEDFSQKSTHMELSAQNNVVPLPNISEKEVMPHSNTIGSSDFYTTPPPSVSPQVTPSYTPPVPKGLPLRVRNASPEKLTSLNSKRFDPLTSPQGSAPLSRIVTPDSTPYTTYGSRPPLTSAPQKNEEYGRGERLKNFYNEGTLARAPFTKQKKEVVTSPNIPVGHKAHMIFFVVGGISLLSLVAVAIFFFLPTAEVKVTPYRIVQNINKEFTGKVNTSSAESDVLPLRLAEREKEVSLTITTTGKSGGTNQKARGTVVIYNNYSAESQPLVATTRLETPDGKLFRLESGVVVPGMTTVNGKKEPGAIEATVVADQAGTDYNSDPTKFTIPGFKGGPKFDSFYAQSTKAMIGGGSGGASDVSVVAKVDTESALRDAKAKAKEEFLNDVRRELGADEKILDEQTDIQPLITPQLPAVGTVANAFDYKGSFKVRAFIFSEKTIKEAVLGAQNQDVQGVQFQPVSSSISYSDSSADYASGTAHISANAVVTLESFIDKVKLQKLLLGKSESDIGQLLQSFPEIKNIQIFFHPEWFVRSVPNSEGRVSIMVLPGESGS